MNQSADTNYGRKQRMAKRKQTPNWCDNVTAIGSIDSPRDGMPLGKLASMRALRNVERPDRPWMTDSERLILVNSQNAWKLDLLELFEVAASASGGRHRWVLVTDQPERLAKAYKRLFKSGTADATLVYRDLIERCHIFHSTFRVESGKRQDFMEGERNIGLYLIAQCEMEDIDALKALEGGDAEAV